MASRHTREADGEGSFDRDRGVEERLGGFSCIEKKKEGKRKTLLFLIIQIVGPGVAGERVRD